MIDPVQSMLLRRPGALSVSLFAPGSRYYGLPTVSRRGPGGREEVYLCRRFVPQPDRFTVIAEHPVRDGDRLDNVTATYLGDPEQFWRVCDANAAMRPDELTQVPGRRVKIALPEGIGAGTAVGAGGFAVSGVSGGGG